MVHGCHCADRFWFKIRDRMLGVDLWAHQWTSAATCFRDYTALDYDGPGPVASYTYGDLDVQANRVMSSFFHPRCIRRGDIVATMTENRPEQVILLLACLKAGAVFAPLPHEFTDAELTKFLDVLQPKLVLLGFGRPPPSKPSGETWSTECIELLDRPGPQGKGDLASLPMTKGGLWAEIDDIEDEAVEAARVTAQAADCGLIFTTSGSTAQPKCVMYSQRVLALWGAEKKANWMRMGVPIPNGPSSTRLINSGIRGITAVYGLLTTFPYGGRIVMENVFGQASGPLVWADLMRRHGVTKVVLFGSSMSAVAAQLHAERFPYVRTVIYSGTCFPPSLVQKAMAIFPEANFIQPYSMTEVPNIALLSSNLHWRFDPQIDRQKSDERLSVMLCAGVPFNSHVWLEDADAEGSGKTVAEGLEGQICVRSPLMMMGYYGREGLDTNATAQVMPDGFVRTGDLGCWVRCNSMSDTPLLKVTGRCRDRLGIPQHDGRNLAAREIEEAISRCASVSDVAVVGLAHPTGAGQMLAAYVVQVPDGAITPEKLISHCKSVGLSGARVPELFIISPWDQPLPTISGKVSKQVLRSLSHLQALASLHIIEALRFSKGDGLVKGTESVAPWERRSRVLFEAVNTNEDGIVTCSDLELFFGNPAISNMSDCREEGGGITVQQWVGIVSRVAEEVRETFLHECESIAAALYRDGSLRRLAVDLHQLLPAPVVL